MMITTMWQERGLPVLGGAVLARLLGAEAGCDPMRIIECDKCVCVLCECVCVRTAGLDHVERDQCQACGRAAAGVGPDPRRQGYEA